MDLSGSSEVSRERRGDERDRSAARRRKPAEQGEAAASRPANSRSVEAAIVRSGRGRSRPRRAAHRFRQGHAAGPLSAARRILSGSVRPRRLGLCRRCRPRAAALRLYLEALVHAGDAGPLQRRHRPRPAHLLLSQLRLRQPRRASSAPGTRMSGWPRAAAASAPIGAMSAASARRSASTARPAASSRSSG